MTTKIVLTPQQRQRLAPLFAEVRSKNAQGDSCAIMAQVFQDGMIIKAVSGKELEALQNAMGSDPSDRQRSVKGH